MKKWWWVFFILLLSAGAYWYFMMRVRVKPEAPVRSALDSTLVVPLSTIRIPLTFKIADLEKTINAKISGVFLQNAIAVGNKKKDSVYLELERPDSIRLHWKPGILSARVPLKIRFRFMKRAAGIRIKNNKPIEAIVDVYLNSRVQFDKDWHIASSTSLQKITWIQEPSIKIVFVNVNLRKVADNYLAKHQKELTTQLDKVIHQLLDTRKPVEKIWNDIQKPIIIKKTEPLIGLLARAEDLQSRWDEHPDGDISGMITLKAKVYSWLDAPPDESIAPLPPHRYADKEDGGLDLYIASKVPFKRLNEFVEQNLHKLSYSYESYSIHIRHAELYGSDQELALELRVKGDLNGKLYLKAQPYFDTTTHVVGLHNLRYDLSTEEILLSSADWMMHDKLIPMISDTVKKDISDILNALPELIERGVEKGKTGEKINLTIDSLSVTSHASLITGTDIQWIFRARGKAAIGLEKKILDGKKKKVAKRRRK